MHVSHYNVKYNYKLREQNLLKVNSIIVSDLKCGTQQCSVASCKANTILGFIVHNFDCKTPEVFMCLYTSLMRLYLEYAVQFWSPHYLKDINKLESVQRRATKLILSMCSRSYEERLKRLDLFSLRDCRTRGDLIEHSKYSKKFIRQITKIFFTFSHTVTRNNGLKLKGHCFNTDLRRNFLTYL